MTLQAFSDSDFGCNPSRRSQTGILIQFYGSPIVWSNREQDIVATSSCEAEYIAFTQAAQKLRAVQLLLQELGVELNCPSPINVDNTSAHGTTSRSKHIDLRFHYIRDMVNRGAFLVRHVPSRDQLADALTKTARRQLGLQIRQG